MTNFGLYHEPKSKMAYMYDKDTVHLRLQTTIGVIDSIEVIYGDPFFWGKKEDDETKWEWKSQTSELVKMNKECTTDMFDHFFCEIKPEFKRAKYAFIINGSYLYGSKGLFDIIKYPLEKVNLFNFFNFPFLNEEDLFKAPSWAKDMVWYSIFPERFNNGDKSLDNEKTLKWGDTDAYTNAQSFGGDLQGIIDKLDYIKEVGFTGIYMTPIFESDTAHKYDTNDYYEIDETFGDKETLRKLVKEAHKRGLKVTMDAVFNHCGFRHPYFQDVLKNGLDSKYIDCFYIIDKTKPIFDEVLNDDRTVSRDQLAKYHEFPRLLNYRTFAFTPLMPKLNTSNPIMRKYLFDVAKYWVREFDIDGWRLDVSNEVSHDFWREFRKELKSVKEDIYIVGENWDNSNPWLQGEQYDGVMNYEILFPIWNYFGTNIEQRKYNTTEFMLKINKVLIDYPKHIITSLYNLVDSHDTARIMETCDNNKTLVKLPYLFMFSFPGAPSIYYGGEIGLKGKHDPDNRRCMIWDEDKQDKDIKEFMMKLISLKKNYHGFNSTEIEWLQYSDSESYVIYKKDDLVFIINNNPHSIKIKVNEKISNKNYYDIYNETDFTIADIVDLAPYGFKILQIR